MRTLRPAAVLSGAAVTVLLLALPASAHVTVEGVDAAQGGFTKLVFRVPTEEDVPTTKVAVTFPADAPLGFASIKAHPGWSYAVTRIKPPKPITTDDGVVDQVVSTITWTATAGGIKPEEFDEFEVDAGPLPEVDQMVFKVLQTYANGDVVRWIDVPPPGSTTEPEHPAPILKLAAAEVAVSPTPSATLSASVSPTVAADKAADGDEDGTGTVLGAAGLAVGVLAALLAVLALRRSRPRA